MRILLILLLLCGTAHAAPFLVCDCQEDFQGDYVLVFDGATQVTSPAQQFDCPAGQVKLKFDVAPLNLSDGQHHLEGWAKNVWEESVHVPFDFKKGAPGSLSGIGLSATQ